MCSHFEKMTGCSRIALASNCGALEIVALSVSSLRACRHRRFRVKVLEPHDPGSNPGAAAY